MSWWRMRRVSPTSWCLGTHLTATRHLWVYKIYQAHHPKPIFWPSKATLSGSSTASLQACSPSSKTLILVSTVVNCASPKLSAKFWSAASANIVNSTSSFKGARLAPAHQASIPVPQSHLSTDSVANNLEPPASYPDPRPSRIPETNTLDDALQYWESGAPEKGLLLPLKSWYAFHSSEYASEAVKLGNIRFVREEFVVHCKEDWDLFESRYPGLRSHYTKLLKAVRHARQQRGEAKCRRSRKRM